MKSLLSVPTPRASWAAERQAWRLPGRQRHHVSGRRPHPAGPGGPGSWGARVGASSAPRSVGLGETPEAFTRRAHLEGTVALGAPEPPPGAPLPRSPASRHAGPLRASKT